MVERDNINTSSYLFILEPAWSIKTAPTHSRGWWRHRADRAHCLWGELHHGEMILFVYLTVKIPAASGQCMQPAGPVCCLWQLRLFSSRPLFFFLSSPHLSVDKSYSFAQFFFVQFEKFLTLLSLTWSKFIRSSFRWLYVHERILKVVYTWHKKMTLAFNSLHK